MQRQPPKSTRHGSTSAASSAPATPATLALEKAGVAFAVHTFEHDPAAEDYGKEAAAALNVPAEQICKTLLVDLDGGPHQGKMGVAVVPVTTMLDLKAVARALGAKKATMADARAAERSTGYVVGGISPLGQKKRLVTVVDSRAASEPLILVSGGRRGFDIEIAPTDLLRMLNATAAPIGRASTRS